MSHGLTAGQEALLENLVRQFKGGWFTLGQVCDLNGGGDKEREPCQKALDGLMACGCVSKVPNDGGTVYYNCTPQSVALGGA